MDSPEPEFALGQWVRVVLNDRNRTPHEGTIRAVIWHHKQQRFHYYLQEGGRKVSKRYAAEDLQPIGSIRDGSAPEEQWIVWRIDDNGNTFVVRDQLTRAEAERMVAEFTARGHKQMYWTERAEQADRYAGPRLASKLE